jgi:hypothetical protein
MCRLLRVLQSGFYAWEDRPLSARAREDIGLTALIHGIHRRSRGAYGAPSIHAELVAVTTENDLAVTTSTVKQPGTGVHRYTRPMRAGF